MENSRRKQVLRLTLIFILGTAFWFLPLPYFQLDYDGGIYALLGRNWAEGKGFTLGGYPNTVYAPLYPAVFAFFSCLGLDLEKAGLGFSLLCWWATMGIFYLLAREFWEDHSALWATLLLSTHGFIVSIFTRFLADVLFIPLLLASLWLCIRLVRDKGLARYAPTIFCWAVVNLAMTLTKTEGAYFFLLQVLFLIVFSPLTRKKSIGILFLALALFFLGLYPYLQFMKEATGRWQLSRKIALNLTHTKFDSPQDWQAYDRINFALNPDKKTIPFYSGPDRNPWLTIKENFPQLMRNYGTNLKSGAKNLAGALHLAGFLLLAVFIYRIKKDIGNRRSEAAKSRFIGTAPLLLLFLTLLIGTFHVFFLFERRVLIQYFVIITLFLGGGLGYIYYRGLEMYPPRKIWAGILVIILLLPWAGISQANALRRAKRAEPHQDFQQQKAAGQLLKKTVPSLAKEKVVALKPTVSFYSGADFLHLPYTESLEDLLLFMQNNEARYLMLSARNLRDRRPLLIPLLDTKKAPDFLEAIRMLGGEDGVVLYRLKDG